MKMDKIPWHLLAGLILGLGLGLLISWVIAPVEYIDAPPSVLRSDFKDEYRSLIAAAYVSTGDLEQAKDRLATLGDVNSIGALQRQAQRAVASGESSGSRNSIAELASDLAQKTASNQVTATSTRFLTQTPLPPTLTGTPPTPTKVKATSEPATVTLTPVPIYTRTPRSTATASPTAGAPYILQSQDEICSSNISEGLLMVYVSDAAQKAVPGVEIIVEHNGDDEHFFTGLKPELGHGYADYEMDTSQSYTLRLAVGSTAIMDLSAPPCQDNNGDHYWGSLRLRFQQP